jgi:hypothetical protein
MISADLGRTTRWLGVALASLAIGSGSIATLGADERGEAIALQRALRLVTVDPSVRVVLIEPELAPDPEALRSLDAFTVRQADGTLRPVIYVNRQSAIVQAGASGSDFYVKVLAAVIHHEARHLEGASESEACRAEMEFFRSLVARGEVPSVAGLSYLQLLARRPDAAHSSLERR